MNRFMILFSLFMVLATGFSCQKPTLTLFNTTEETSYIWIFAHRTHLSKDAYILKEDAIETLSVNGLQQSDTIEINDEVRYSVYAENVKRTTLCIVCAEFLAQKDTDYAFNIFSEKYQVMDQ